MQNRRQFMELGAGAVALGALPSLAHANQGVSKTEIVIGSIQDLSGPIVSLGKPVQNGMIMRVEEANAGGGIHGRKIKLVVEDSGYDPKKGVLAAQKLLNQDKIFAMVGTLGSAVSLSTLNMVIEKKVPHLFPITAATGNHEPFNKYKYAFATPYTDQMIFGLREMLKMKGYKRVGILLQDDEYGADILKGVEQALKTAGQTLVEKTSYKRGATDFSSQMQKLKAANPDLIVLATVVRETIGAMATGRQLGYTGDFFGSTAVYMPATAKAGGKAVEGLYAMCETPTPYRDDPKNPTLLNKWLDTYKARFNEEADLWSTTGYSLMDWTLKTIDKVGPNLNGDAFVKVLDNSVFPRSYLGTPEYSFTPTRHLGNNSARIAQIINGRWANISDFHRL